MSVGDTEAKRQVLRWPARGEGILTLEGDVIIENDRVGRRVFPAVSSIAREELNRLRGRASAAIVDLALCDIDYGRGPKDELSTARGEL